MNRTIPALTLAAASLFASVDARAYELYKAEDLSPQEIQLAKTIGRERTSFAKRLIQVLKKPPAKPSYVQGELDRIAHCRDGGALAWGTAVTASTPPVQTSWVYVTGGGVCAAGEGEYLRVEKGLPESEIDAGVPNIWAYDTDGDWKADTDAAKMPTKTVTIGSSTFDGVVDCELKHPESEGGGEYSCPSKLLAIAGIRDRVLGTLANLVRTGVLKSATVAEFIK